MPNVFRLDPHDAKLGLLTPFLAQRIERYAAEYQQAEVIPSAYAWIITGELWKGNPDLLAIGIVDPDTGLLLGHLLALAIRSGEKLHVEVVQLQADQNVGDARFQALEHAIGWAKELGTPDVLVLTHRDGKELERLGFKRMRTVHRLVADTGSAGKPKDEPPEQKLNFLQAPGPVF